MFRKFLENLMRSKNPLFNNAANLREAILLCIVVVLDCVLVGVWLDDETVRILGYVVM